MDVWDRNAEETQEHADEIDDRNPTCRRNYSEFEILCRTNPTRAVSDQEAEKAAKGQARRLHCDAGKREIEHSRDTANDNSLEQCIKRGGHGGPTLLENGHQGHHKSTDRTNENHWTDLLVLGHLIPTPCCSSQSAK